MAAIKVLKDTFKVLGKNSYGDQIGTIEVSLGFRGTVLTKAYVTSWGEYQLAGFVGRYRTSTKPWLASVGTSGDGLYVAFGRDDRSGRFNKQNAIAFEPETYHRMANEQVWNVI